jgi:CDP-paratose 2-epimerase
MFLRWIDLPKLLVTGSSGLIGSEVVSYFAERQWSVYGVDNNSRAVFFGPEGDTTWNRNRLLSQYDSFKHYELDIRSRVAIMDLVGSIKFDACVHAAAQPSHDLAAKIPFDDFDVNAVGTLNLLEAFRRHAPESPFIFISTNKVYGDAPNELPLVELDCRWDYERPEDYNGVREDMRIDRCTHSLFGASKAAADLLVQEYGRYFGMPTCCLRGGCLTGPLHSGVELHGFLNYLAKAVVEQRPYKIYGYKGKQVRDNIHALDVARFVHKFIENPRSSAVYNIGGGRANSCSMLEAIEMFQQVAGRKLQYEYIDQNRIGDHICYISDLGKITKDYPEWNVSVPLQTIVEQTVHYLAQQLPR